MLSTTENGSAVHDGLTESQWAAIRALRPLNELPVPTHEAHRPASIYTSETRFRLEQEKLFKKLPVPITVSASLPETGMLMAHDGYGIPLLVTRDRAGTAHVFLNACRHRGSKLHATCDAAKGARIVCPYHAWSYTLDGKLAGITRADTFPSLRKEELGLIELPSEESGGFIWATLDPKHPATLVEGTDALAADLEAFGLPTMHIYGRRTYELPANWKLVYEPFLEGYHVQRLHAKSIAKLFADTPTQITFLGRHIRQTSGKANFDPSLLSGGIDKLHRHITHAYQLFPNAIFITSPYYFSVMILMPRAANRTILDYYMMVKAPPDSPKAEEIYARSFQLAHDVFGGEDFRAATLQQEALAPGLIEEVYYGGLEEAIEPFHKNIESYVDT
jgi:phenylpropionate dioxygenase-like ring-hydroxylating dioxygenase large terminal subunit